MMVVQVGILNKITGLGCIRVTSTLTVEVCLGGLGNLPNEWRKLNHRIRVFFL